MKLIKKVGKADIQTALDEVTAKCGAETANLVRAICDSFSLVIEESETAQAVTAAGWQAQQLEFMENRSPAATGWHAGR